MKKVFGEDLVSVLLYGSCATGTNHIESDIDIALILTSRGKSSFSRDGDERSYACDRLELEMYKKLGMPVSLLVWTMERLEKEKMFGTSFARNLAEKSINLLPQGNANVGNHLSEANDADAYKKKLVEAALFESMHKIQDCMSSMEKGRWRTANYDLYYALPAQYRRRAAWVMNSGTLKAVENLVDTNDRPLVGSLTNISLAVGQPDVMRGRPIVVDEFVPDVAADAYPIVFGDLSGYIVLDRVGFSVQRLSELYAETNITLLLARKRIGGYLAEPYRVKVMKTGD